MVKEEYDVVVVGGGPSGMMAAGRAAALGARVVLLEKNASLGVKLLMTGGGRSNITNAEFEKSIFLGKLDDAAKFLFSPFSRFDVQDTFDFFHALGMPTKIEAEKRAFPKSDTAQSVWDALVRYMKEGNVTILHQSEADGLETQDDLVSGVRLKKGEMLRARSYVLATGGKSRPETGSTGDGFLWLQQIGHTLNTSRPALVPIRLKEDWLGELFGLSFPEAKVIVFQHGKRQMGARGKILFTHTGLSGPLILNMSQAIGEFLQYGHVTLSLDFFPQKSIGELDREVQGLFSIQKNKQVKNSLTGFVPPILTPVLLRLARIDPDTPVHSVTKEARASLMRLVKDFPAKVEGLLDEGKAVVTSGGVLLEEIDCKHMRSRLYPNLYFAGDLLDINRPSGGYSLQLCWTTGFVAGTSAAGK